ncbi:uncharacterized protein LOC130509434 [Raphanus sativus]|uniref:Uncharacterized protein LOC130509434 n=1 Tax=Raphanus sativus TaxID=3726 RepID=A0A9W3DC27_RAPSA|nr:uncharacterized protein LOC130509434 [Raphanus sativus]
MALGFVLQANSCETMVSSKKAKSDGVVDKGNGLNNTRGSGSGSKTKNKKKAPNKADLKDYVARKETEEEVRDEISESSSSSEEARRDEETKERSNGVVSEEAKMIRFPDDSDSEDHEKR